MSGAYSGSLQIKKKAELQEIAQALAVSDAGTREDLLQRIKKHLEDNSAELESHSVFSGLYTTRGGRRQRSVQPVSGVPPPQSTGDNSKFAAIPEERAVTPPVEEEGLRSAPQSPGLGTGLVTPSPSRRRGSASPRNVSLQSPSPAKSLITKAEAQPEARAALEGGSDSAAKVWQTFSFVRTFLSSGQNIFAISALLDFLGILYNIHVNAAFPVPPVYTTPGPSLHATTIATLYWSLPSIVVPSIIGYLVSFSSPPSQARFDVLSASIIRLAANFVDVYPSMAFVEQSKTPVRSLDVLGFRWRAVSSGVALAFAFAEAIVARNNGV